jgi:hypothetical protein
VARSCRRNRTCWSDGENPDKDVLDPLECNECGVLDILEKGNGRGE